MVVMISSLVFYELMVLLRLMLVMLEWQLLILLSMTITGDTSQFKEIKQMETSDSM